MRPPLCFCLASLLAIFANSVWAQQLPKKTPPLWKHWLTLPSPNDQPVHCLAFSRGGQQIAGGQVDGKVVLWNVNTGHAKMLQSAVGGEAHGLAILALAFTPRDKGLLLVHRMGVERWQFDETKPTEQITWKKLMIEQAAFSPDGKWLAVTDLSGTIWVWDVDKGKQIGALKGHTSIVFGLRFSPDGTRLASGDAEGEVRVWDVASEKTIAHLKTEKVGLVRDVVFAKGGTRIYAVGLRDGVRLWDVATKKLLRTFQGRVFPFSTVAVTPGETTVAAGSVNGAVLFWDPATGRQRHHYRMHLGMVRASVLSPDGKLLATNSGEFVKLLDDRRPVPIQARKPSPQQLAALWQQAQGTDDVKRLRAILQLAAVPKETLALLKSHLPLRKLPDPKRARKLINDLDNRRFPIRSRATAELKTMGRIAYKALRQRLKKPVTLEMKMRADRILADLEAPKRRFWLPSIDILYRINNAEARRLLQLIHRVVVNDDASRMAGEVLKSMPQRP